jgi:small GTP-binding protein
MVVITNHDVELHSDLNLKVILIGESGAGKSSILERFTRNTFSDVTQSTIAVDFQIKYAQIKSKRVAVQVWDTAGQEKYFTITTGYYRQADAVLLVCDLTSTESYNRLDKW